MDRRSFLKGLLTTVASVSIKPEEVIQILKVDVKSGFNVECNTALIRANLWSKQIKELLLEELNFMKYEVDLVVSVEADSPEEAEENAAQYLDVYGIDDGVLVAAVTEIEENNGEQKD